MKRTCVGAPTALGSEAHGGSVGSTDVIEDRVRARGVPGEADQRGADGGAVRAALLVRSDGRDDVRLRLAVVRRRVVRRRRKGQGGKGDGGAEDVLGRGVLAAEVGEDGSRRRRRKRTHVNA